MRTKATFAGLLAIALLAPAGAVAQLVNQLENPGFEDGEGDALPEWREVAGSVDATEDAVEGDRAALLNAVGGTNTTLAQEVALPDDLPTVPALEYRFEFAAKFNTGADTPATDPPTSEAKIVWKNELNQTSRVDRIPLQDVDGYKEYNLTAQAPVDATRADIQFDLQPLGRTDANLKVDAVAFGPADPTA